MRTVRSAAWSRNRPRRRLAWLLLLILIALLALVARIDAAPRVDPIDPVDPIDLAIRYADAITGADAEAEARWVVDDDEDDSEDDEAALDDEADGDDADDARDDVGAAVAALDELGDGAVAAGATADRLLARQTNDGDGMPGAPATSYEMLEVLPDELPEAWGNATSADTELGALALRDAELAPGDPMAGADAAAAAAPAGAAEVYEQWTRHRRPSPWGRLDIAVALRRRWSAPMHAPPAHDNELWLVATWRQ